MRRFALRLFGFAFLLVSAGLSIVIVRLVCWQSRVKQVFTVRPETEVICIGSSHTGCTWAERSDYKNQLYWNSMNSIPLAVLRLRELARQNDLSHVRVCMVDFDVMGFCDLRFMDEVFVSQFPFTWRYLSDAPWTGRPLKLFIERPGASWAISDYVPSDTTAWSERSDTERREHLERVYCGDRQQLNKLLEYPRWRDIVRGSVKELHDICKAHQIHLILFSSPVVSQSPDRTDPDRNRVLQEMVAEVKKMGIDYKDYRAAMSDCDFRDSNHLLPNAAERFTQKVFDEVWSVRRGAL